GTISVTVTAGTTGGNITVTAGNGCGNSSAQTKAVTVATTPSAPTANSGSGATCTQISANWSTSTGATAYFLDVSTANDFSSFVTGYQDLNVGNVTTKNVTGLTTSTTYYYRVRASNTCGTSASSNVITIATTAPTPATPGSITGTTTVCRNTTGLTYSIAAVTGATTYTWTVPANWTITNGQGTASITVTATSTAQNGNITVTAGNACGTSSASSLAVTTNPRPTA